MDISIRSYLTAGVAAVVGTTAIGLAPAMPSPDLRAAALPAPVVAEIALTGTSIPWESIAAVVKALSTGGSLQGGITSLIGSIGTEFAKEALPVVTAFAGDLVKYLATTVLTDPGIDLQAILDSVGAAITTGNIGGVVKALTSGLSVSVTQITKLLLTPEFQSFIVTKAGTVLGALPEILRSSVQKIVGIDIKPVIDLLSGLISKIIPGVTLPGAAVAAPRALAAAAVPASAVASLAAAPAPAAAEAPSAPEVTPAASAEAPKAPADSAPDVKTAVEAPAAESSVAEAAPEVTPVTEVASVTEVAPVESVAPESVPSADAPKASGATESAPAAPARGAKPGPRHSADSGSSTGRG